jgi:hypothetical protein
MASGPSGRTVTTRALAAAHLRRKKNHDSTSWSPFLTCSANVCVSLRCPRQRSTRGILKTDALQPAEPARVELASIDLRGQGIGPSAGLCVRLATHAADELLGDAAVPDVVQVEIDAVPLDVDAVAAACNILVVQRLVGVTDEVHDKLSCNSSLRGRQRGVEQTSGIVVDGGHDAPVGLTVAGEVDSARSRRVILCVDEVEVGAETAPFCVAHRVGPCRDPREVVLGVVVQQALEVGCRVTRHEVARNVCDCDVSEA